MTAETTPATLWEGRTADSWREQWHVPRLVLLETVGSTNDVARALAERGAPAGLVVLADQQTAGRGRLGRSWQTQPGDALLFSLLIRPPAPGAAPGTLPLRIGAAAARALRAATGVEVRVKWPNDLVVPERGKLAGILCEGVGAGADGGYIVAGIGINVRDTAAQWPAELRATATSLDACAGRRHDRPALMAALLEELLPLCRAVPDALSAEELAGLHGLDALAGAAVTLDDDPEPWHVRDIAADGALIVTRDDLQRRITAATVRPVSTSRTTP